MSRGCALWMSESKCQRSRSQCSDYWKWFLAHNCFPFTSAIIKLHAQIPCESRICLTDIGVKKLGSLNWLPLGVFVPLGQPHSSFIVCHAEQHYRYTSVFEMSCNWFCWILGHIYYNFCLYFKCLNISKVIEITCSLLMFYHCQHVYQNYRFYSFLSTHCMTYTLSPACLFVHSTSGQSDLSELG